MSALLFSLVIFSFGLFYKDFFWALTRGLGAFVFCISLEALYFSYVMFSITEIVKGFSSLLTTVFS